MNNNYIQEIICKIISLQQQEFDNDISNCERPFLGPPINNNIYNTRPVQLYNSYQASPWEFNYQSGETESTSNIFRLEAMNNDSVTIRLLSLDTETSTYTDTNTFATVSLNTIGAIKCFPDTYIDL